MMTLVIRGIGAIVILIMLIVLIPLGVPGMLGYKTYDVISGSMEPEIPVGSLIVVQPSGAEALETGTVIAFSRNGSVVCHRVVENDTSKQLLRTKGDANADPDLQEVPYENVIGIVRYHLPYLGLLGEILSTAQGKAGAALLFFASVLLIRVGEQLEQEKEKKN